MDNNTTGLYQLDKTILHYINNEMNLFILDSDNNKIKVPCVYNNYFSEHKSEYLDENNKLKLPLITIERNSENEKDVYNMIRPNRYVDYIVGTKIDNKGNYTLENVDIPIYLELDFEINIKTNFIEDMNFIKETFLKHNKTYWSHKINKYKKVFVKINFDSFSNSNKKESESEENIIESTISLNVEGKIQNIKNLIKKKNEKKIIYNTKISFSFPES